MLKNQDLREAQVSGLELAPHEGNKVLRPEAVSEPSRGVGSRQREG